MIYCVSDLYAKLLSQLHISGQCTLVCITCQNGPDPSGLKQRIGISIWKGKFTCVTVTSDHEHSTDPIALIKWI